MKIILVGFGVVGSGLASALASRGTELKRRGLEFKIVAAVDSRSAAVDERGLDPAKLLERKKATGRVGTRKLSAAEVIGDVECDAVVEVTPGSPDAEPALSHIRKALRASRNVVTANKMPLALNYSDLLREAGRRGTRILYGACVGGGMPILEFGGDCAEAEPVDGIEGVLNATSNFILTRMEEGVSYNTALREAQELGYAETDPSMDVDGIDAACKIVILSNHVMKEDYTLGDVKPLGGIRRITQASVKKARAKGRALRLVSRARKSLDVGAIEVDEKSALGVRGAAHAVVFHCRYSGERAIIGPGAGSVTTSLAVLRDLITLSSRVGA